MNDRNSQAHWALTYARPNPYVSTVFAPARRIDFEDGSRLSQHIPGVGWIVSLCIPECGCLKGREALAERNRLVGMQSHPRHFGDSFGD